MSSSLPQNPLSDDAPDAVGHYWAIRQWTYDWRYAPGGLRKKPDPEGPVAPTRRRQSGIERPEVASDPPDAIICQCLNQLTISKNGTLSHAGIEVPVRPMATRLLLAIRNASGRALPLAEMCHALWGRPKPASISAMHTTVFRANDALLRVRCPLRIAIQHQWATITHASTHAIPHARPESD